MCVRSMVTIHADARSASSAGTLGNEDLEPELSMELEGGLDMGSPWQQLVRPSGLQIHEGCADSAAPPPSSGAGHSAREPRGSGMASLRRPRLVMSTMRRPWSSAKYR